MSELVTNILPIILLFILGYTLNKIYLLNKDNADLFLKVVFYLCTPALILVSLSVVDLTLEMA